MEVTGQLHSPVTCPQRRGPLVTAIFCVWILPLSVDSCMVCVNIADSVVYPSIWHCTGRIWRMQFLDILIILCNQVSFHYCLHVAAVQLIFIRCVCSESLLLPILPSVVFRSCFFSIVHYKALLGYNWTFFLVCHVCWCNLLYCWFVVSVFEKNCLCPFCC